MSRPGHTVGGGQSVLSPRPPPNFKPRAVPWGRKASVALQGPQDGWSQFYVSDWHSRPVTV